MANYGFIIDNRRCIGCHACTVACKSEHDVPIGVNRTWVKYIEKGVFPDSRRLFSVMRCNHCDDAPCVEICPVTALFRRSDGIVDFDSRRCIGCKACMQACPYDALYIDPNTRTAAKCNYCAHRVDLGLEPACVNVCPTQAIISGDLDDPDSNISRLKSRQAVTVRKPEKATLPQLYYIDGDRASLDSAAAPPTSESMWSRQVRGVGHYAHVVEQRVAMIARATNTASGPADRTSDQSASLPHLNRLQQFQVERLPPAAVPATVLSKRHALDTLRDALGLNDPTDGVVSSVDPQRSPSVPAGDGSGARRSYDAPNKGVLWGWQVSGYVWTKAISAGTGLVTSLAAIWGGDILTAGTQWAAWLVALIFLGLTGALLVMDLDQPKRFLYVMLRPQWRSWLVRGAWIINAYALVLAFWFVALVRGQGLEGSWLRWPLVIAAALTAIYTAFLFAQARGRDFWQSPLLAVHMLLHAVIAGSATMSMVSLFAGLPGWIDFMATLLLVSLTAKLVVDAFELATTHGTADSRAVAKMITRGRFCRLYWTGVVAIGCLLPIVLVLVGPPPMAALAGVLALTGLYCAEHVWVRAPQLVSLD